MSSVSGLSQHVSIMCWFYESLKLKMFHCFKVWKRKSCAVKVLLRFQILLMAMQHSSSKNIECFDAGTIQEFFFRVFFSILRSETKICENSPSSFNKKINICSVNSRNLRYFFIKYSVSHLQQNFQHFKLYKKSGRPPMISRFLPSTYLHFSRG